MNNRQTRASTTRRYIACTEKENAAIAHIPQDQRGPGPRLPAPPSPGIPLDVQAARRAARKAIVKQGRSLRR